MYGYTKNGVRYIELDEPIEAFVAHSMTWGEDELYHWKYVKRYQVNGKWRYVYADKGTHIRIDSAKALLDSSIKDSRRAKENLRQDARDYLDRKKRARTEEDRKKAREDYEAFFEADNSSLDRANRLTNNYMKEYDSLTSANSVKTLVTAKLDKAKSFVKNIFGKKA